MGWCSGTEIFDEAVDAAKAAGVKGLNLRDFAIAMIKVLEDHDWDCQCESEYYEKPGMVQQAFKIMHPEWFEDEEDERD